MLCEFIIVMFLYVSVFSVQFTIGTPPGSTWRKNTGNSPARNNMTPPPNMGSPLRRSGKNHLYNIVFSYFISVLLLIFSPRNIFTMV